MYIKKLRKEKRKLGRGGMTMPLGAKCT